MRENRHSHYVCSMCNTVQTGAETGKQGEAAQQNTWYFQSTVTCIVPEEGEHPQVWTVTSDRFDGLSLDATAI